MNTNKRTYVGIAVVALIIIAAVLVSSHKKNNDSMAMNNATSSNSSSSSNSKVDTSGAVAATSVKLVNYAFSPAAIKVKVGDTVTWTNSDQVHHSVTADMTSSSAPNSPLFGEGETYTFKFTKAGTYTYHCMPHPYMHGTVIVTE